jgi:hypothetical protein
MAMTTLAGGTRPPTDPAGRQGARTETIPLVRDRVRGILLKAPAYAALAPDERREVAHAMVNVAQYLTDAGGDTRDLPLAIAPVAGPAVTLADSPEPPPSDPPPPDETDPGGGPSDNLGGAQAADAGVDALGRAIDNVDFPGFVAGLVDGVFNAIVTSSIKQMEAFAELVKNVSKTVDAFMKDNVSPDQARDYLADKYPDQLEVDTTGDRAVVRPKPDADTDALPDFFSDLGLDAPVTSLDQDTVDQQLVPAARKKIALDRQQVLLSLVLMGINRLVVTTGTIKASVMFNIDTLDKITTHRTRTYDHNRTRNQKWGNSKFGWFLSPSTSYSDDLTSTIKVNTVSSRDSERTVDLKTKLTGDVSLQFRNDAFPLSQMTQVLGIAQPEAPPPVAAPASSRAPVAPPPLPPLPPLPAGR